jgi:DNA polymerase-3 subunit gamma/tau
MSYLALARKWRPRTFSQLVGQEHINKALINALDQQRLHHAYLFTGTRGVGKTSVARILAKALNCRKDISSEPCLQCDVCISIEQGCFIDLIEIDGASKTRVEDTRDLLDNVPYAPATGRFKIYLIDEVHMLSQHSFNALLKTLEEPPAHVKFILATTDPQKLPVTVLSRCLQFTLRHLSIEIITKQLQLILTDEQLDFEVPALEILAQAARGSMRDALSLLDQAITSCDKQLLASDVKSILGYTQHDYALKVLFALAEQNASTLIALGQEVALEGSHFQYVLDEILKYLHHITVYQSIGDANPLIKPTKEVKILAKQFSAEDIQLFYQIGLKGRDEIYLAPTLIIGFNMTLLRMLTFRPATRGPIPPLAFKQEAAEPDRIQDSSKAITEPVTEEAVALEDPKYTNNVTINTPPAIKIDECISIEAKNWAELIPNLKLTGLALNAIQNTEFVAKEGKEVILQADRGHCSLFTPTIKGRIASALSAHYQSPVNVILNSKESVCASPAQQKEKAQQHKQHNAEAALSNDPVFLQLQQEFSAELVKNSIVPLKDDI